MTIHEEVAKRVAGFGPKVQDIVIDKLVDVEVERRVLLVTQGVNRLENLRKDFNKINRDDLKSYTGGVAVSSMSEKRFQEIGKAKENLDRLEKQLDKTLTENTPDSYNKLSEIIQKLNATGNPKESSGAASEEA